MAHYHVEKSRLGSGWLVRRVDQAAHIGRVGTKREAMLIARMLAGWRGVVTTGALREAMTARAQ